MTLVIAHGVPKSGSTFIYQIAKDALAAINGFSHREAKERFFPGESVPDFVPQPTDEIIERLSGRLPAGSIFVIKTHGRLTPLISAGLATGKIKALTSFRDPRDTVVSMLDTGERDRRRGADRSFGKLFHIDDAVRPARHAWKVAREWLSNASVLPIPYYLTASAQNEVIKLVFNHLGASAPDASLQAHYASEKEKRITEFYKGVPDRFLDSLTREEMIELGEKLAPIISEVDSMTAHWMAVYGYDLHYRQLSDRRRTKLAEICGSE
jgi:hypothetical protein